MPRLLTFFLIVTIAFSLLGIVSPADAAPAAAAFAAKASVAPQIQYLNDTAGTVFTFTIHNTGTTASIGAVEIDRPSNLWTIIACPQAPTGWSATRSDTMCRYRSADGTADDIKPGTSNNQFQVTATTQPGTSDRTGAWGVIVSKSNQFDNKSLLAAAQAEPPGLGITVYSWEILDAIVDGSPNTAGSACPTATADNHSAITGSTGHTIVICGKNHMSVAGTPQASRSSLSGTFIASSGTFSSGSVAANSLVSVVLGKWSNVSITSSAGTGKTVIAKTGSASNQTSPLTTLNGYEAKNQPPVATDDSYSTNEDTALNVPAPGVLGNDSDPDGNPITAVLVAGPTHGTLTLNTNGSFSYTPDANFNGLDSFTYKAQDSFGAQSAAATVNIPVNPVNDAPVAVNDTYNVDETAGNAVALNVPASDGVLKNDTDIDGDTLSAVLVSGPSHGTLTLNADGSLSYTPAVNYFGNDSFTYKANDGTADSNVATVTITINHVNSAPTANGDAYATDEDTPLTVSAPGVLANDTDPDIDTLTAILVSGPAHGALSLNADGSFSYTPAANYNGSDSFTYKANDGQADSNSATVNLTVNPINDAPTAVDDSYTTNEDQTLTQPAPGILANDSDIENDPLTAILVSGPAHASSFSLNADGSFSYTPATNYNGPDSFTYKANDGQADSNAATVNLTVTPVNDAPTADAKTASAIQAQAATIGLSGSDVETCELTFSIVTQPSHGSLGSITNSACTSGTPNTDSASVVYTSDAGYTGPDSFTYKVTDGGEGADGSLDSTPATVSVTVNPPNAAPVASAQSVTTNEDTAKTITLSATDADGDALTFSIVSGQGPIFGTLGSIGSVTCDGNTPNTCTADVTYTPNANYSGSDSFKFTANDTHNDSAPATVSITVNAVNDAPSFTKGADQTVLEDSGAKTVAGWATNISSGPADESGQTVSFTVTNDNNSLFSAQPAVAANGTLTYTPAPDAFGSATVSVTAQDDGGTANGGVDTSAAQTFLITVTGINDAPTFTKGADQTVDEDAGAQTVNGWATGISAGPNESSQTVSFIIDSNDNPSLFSAGPAVAVNGTLTFTSAANQNGVAHITLHAKDDGGTANGGVDSSATQSFVITVNAVNDPPVAQTKTASAQANMKITGINAGLLTGVTDADTGINGCSPTFSVASITSNTGGTVSNVNLAAGTFDFDPAPGFTGTAVANYTVADNGCPGTATSAAAAINISVSGPVIWFVNPASLTNGDGRLSNPFNTLASVPGVDNSGDRIFVYTGTAASGITLNSNEWLIGQGVTAASFDAVFSITPPAGTIARPSVTGTRPVIQGNVVMAGSDAVRGLNIQPASGTAGLSSSGATGLTVGEVSVNTTNAIAVNLTNSDGTFSFTRIDANGGANGIVWNNASAATGSFTVSGSGTAGSGGTIQNASGPNILISNAANVSLSRMNIQNSGDDGIRGTNVTGFTLANSTVSGNGNAVTERGIEFTGLFGTASITDSTITASAEDNLYVNNTSGTLSLTVGGTPATCQISNTSTTVGNDGIQFLGDGTANMTINVSNCTFNHNRGDHFQATTTAANTVVMNAVFQNNTLTGDRGTTYGGTDLGGGVTINPAGNSQVTFTVSNNNFQGATSSAITINNSASGAATTSLSGTVSGNTIGTAATVDSGSSQGDGITVASNGLGTTTVLVSGNTIRQYSNLAGIDIAQRDGNGSLHVTVSGNTITNPGTFASNGILAQAGATSTDAGNACYNIGGAGANSIAGSGANGSTDFRVRQRFNTTIRLPGYAGAATDTAAVVSFIQGLNTGSETGSATVGTVPPAGGFVGGAACNLP